MTNLTNRPLAAAMIAAAFIAAPLSAQAQSYAPNAPISYPATVFSPVMHDDNASAGIDESSPLHRQVVNYPTREAPGTIVIDTPHTFLYLVLGNGRALRYGIGVGREGFTWAGTQTISRKAEWPDWYPPREMIARQPYLPRFVAGGPNNPLGARALYLGQSEYRIHGTNDPSTIGHHVSSGCIRLTNEDVTDLFSRVSVGSKVIVLPQTAHNARTSQAGPREPRYATARDGDSRQTMIVPVAAARTTRPMSLSPTGVY